MLDYRLAACQHLPDRAVCLVSGSGVPVKYHIPVNRGAQLAHNWISRVGAAADNLPRDDGLIGQLVRIVLPARPFEYDCPGAVTAEGIPAGLYLSI